MRRPLPRTPRVWVVALAAAAAGSGPRLDDALLQGAGLLAQVTLPGGFTFDPAQLVQDAFATLLQKIGDGIRAGLDALWAANFITQTPKELTYANADITSLYGTMRTIANAALALVAVVGGLNVVLRPHFGLTYHSLSELVPRLVLGAILVNTALFWVQFAIDVNNGVAASIAGATPSNWPGLNGAHQALVDILLGLVYVIVGVLLVIQMLMRLAWIDVLLVVSPLAAACWVLPQTQGWARAWNEQFTGTVFVQVLQVVALKLGGILLTSVVRLTPDVTWMSVLVGAAVLVLTWRIPGLLHVGAGGNIADTLARALLFRAVLRGGR